MPACQTLKLMIRDHNQKLTTSVPGWHRITFMKYSTAYPDPSLHPIEDCWAYEGVVLPGGKVMFGRWWQPEDEEESVSATPEERWNQRLCSGPFVFWAVGGEDDEQII